MNINGNFYDNTASGEYSEVLAVEVGTLQQDIPLPEVTDEPLTYKFLEEGGEYTTPFTEYKNMVGNFYIPVLFPLVEDGESTELEFSAPDTKNIVSNGNYLTGKYVERNFVSLTIPKYILMNFKEKVPAGTKFLIGFVGGSTLITNMNVIGIVGSDLSLEE